MKYKIKNKLISLASLLCVSSHLIHAVPAVETEDYSAEALSLRLSSTGSFEAEYWATHGSRNSRITLLNIRELKYGMVKIENADRAEVSEYIILDYSLQDGNLYILRIENGQGIRIRVPYREVAGPYGELMTLFKALANSLADSSLTISSALFPDPNCIRFSLGTKNDGFFLSMEITGRDSLTAAKWIDDMANVDSQNVHDNDKTVVIKYTDSHSVEIDKKTGLLIRDERHGATPENSRCIKLLKYSLNVDQIHYSEKLPYYKNVIFEDKIIEGVNQQFYLGIISEFGKRMAGIDNYKDLLRRYEDDIMMSIRNAGRQQIRKSAPSMIGDDVAKWIISKYDEMKNETSGDASWSSFVSEIMNSVEKEPEPIRSHVLKHTGRNKIAGAESIMQKLPEEIRDTVREIYETYAPAYYDGIIVELFAAALKKATDLRKAACVGESGQRDPHIVAEPEKGSERPLRDTQVESR